MTTSLPPKSPPASTEGYEFELIDLASAREALDDASIELAAEAARPVADGDWERRRRRPVVTDRALTGPTIEWMLRLPEGTRPVHLADMFPRLANQIAPLWHEAQRCATLLQALLTDDRGGRRGLPTAVRDELCVLLSNRRDQGA